jgi:hypothetical protein
MSAFRRRSAKRRTLSVASWIGMNVTRRLRAIARGDKGTGRSNPSARRAAVSDIAGL